MQPALYERLASAAFQCGAVGAPNSCLAPVMADLPYSAKSSALLPSCAQLSNNFLLFDKVPCVYKLVAVRTFRKRARNSGLARVECEREEGGWRGYVRSWGMACISKKALQHSTRAKVEDILKNISTHPAVRETLRPSRLTGAMALDKKSK